VQNHSDEYEFDLHENKPVGFDTEAKGNPEMAYSGHGK